MEIKNIKHINKNGIVASGTVVMEDEVFINDITVFEGEKGIFFNMPGKNYMNEDTGEWHTHYFAVPTDKESFKEILQSVKAAVAEGKLRGNFDNPYLKGYTSVKAKNVSIVVSYTDKGTVITPSRKYEKDGETKYAHYVVINKEQADAIAEAFKAALA